MPTLLQELECRQLGLLYEQLPQFRRRFTEGRTTAWRIAENANEFATAQRQVLEKGFAGQMKMVKGTKDADGDFEMGEVDDGDELDGLNLDIADAMAAAAP